jgi:fatty-acyl-CoA synthase
VTLVSVNPAYRSHELRYVLQHSKIRPLFLVERDARADYRGIFEESRNGERLPLEPWCGTAARGGSACGRA